MNNFFEDNLYLTVFDGEMQNYEIQLSKMKKNYISFGRQSDCDIVLTSEYVSRIHGCIYMDNGKCYVEDINSRNGLLYNGRKIKMVHIKDGDYIRITSSKNDGTKGVLFVFNYKKSEQAWKHYSLYGKKRVTCGRAPDNDICLEHISISGHHAEIIEAKGKYIIRDLNSTNGIYVNGKKVRDKVTLYDKDLILISHTKIIFNQGELSYICARNGISVKASNVVKTVTNKKVTICDNVSLEIMPGELVAIIGGSGAGKSTLMNCICGYSRPTYGEIRINDVDLYENYDVLKHLIGYVPQQDIVYDNLTVESMLYYSARLRLPEDLKPEEIHLIVDKVLDTVELGQRKDTYVKNLSGGQKKRASIAVELLTDPKLFFLDEPASGLDPGTERNLIKTLKGMTASGKTVVLVTHSTLNLDEYDKIVFMGPGGKLCFCGNYREILGFFQTDDIVNAYEMVSSHTDFWHSRYASLTSSQNTAVSGEKKELNCNARRGFFHQLRVLCARYIRLLLNDRQRMLLLMLQAPLLAFLISLVADGKEFEQYEVTKSLLFALSCCGFWIGILSAIQEICKERNILKREYMTGMNLCSYIISKILVLGILCLIQTILIVTTFSLLIHYPNKGVSMYSYIEYSITTWLTAMAAAAMGLFVSSLFSNADRAMTIAPLLLMPQILFSGVIFTLEGVTKIISYLTVCRWSMEGYGSSADLNTLTTRLQDMGYPVEHETESAFEFSINHLFTVWGVMFLFIVLFSAIAGLQLRRLRRTK